MNIQNLLRGGLVVTALSCGSSACRTTPSADNGMSAGSSSVPDGQETAVVFENTNLAASDASIPATDAGTVVAAPEPVDPLVAVIRALGAPNASLIDAIDPARGLSVINYIEAPPSGRGRQRISNDRHCGPALRRALPAVQRDIADFVQRMSDPADVECADGACTVHGMEYQPELTLRFATAGDGGTPKLESIEQLSVAALPDAWVTRARAHVTSSLASGRARPCPAPR